MFPGFGQMHDAPIPAPEQPGEVGDAELFAALMKVQRATCIQDAMAMMRSRFVISKR